MEKVLKILESWVGYLEKKSNKDLDHKTKNAGSKNYTCFARDYKEYTGENYQGQAWCAMFISVCFVVAYGLANAKKLLCGKLYSYCPYGMKAFKDKKQLHTTPKAGDIVFFLRNGVAKHTGFVYKVSGSKIYTIEGNTSGASGVVANGGGVCKKSYTVNNNMRFGRPDYSIVSAQKADTGTQATAAKKYAGTFPVLPDRGYYMNGDGIKTLTNYTTQIKRLQKLLNWLVNAGLKVDGDYGNATEKAVRAYQQAYGLVADGKFGKKSLEKAKTIKK